MRNFGLARRLCVHELARSLWKACARVTPFNLVKNKFHRMVKSIAGSFDRGSFGSKWPIASYWQVSLLHLWAALPTHRNKEDCIEMVLRHNYRKIHCKRCFKILGLLWCLHPSWCKHCAHLVFFYKNGTPSCCEIIWLSSVFCLQTCAPSWCKLVLIWYHLESPEGKWLRWFSSVVWGKLRSRWCKTCAHLLRKWSSPALFLHHYVRSWQEKRVGGGCMCGATHHSSRLLRPFCDFTSSVFFQ